MGNFEVQSATAGGSCLLTVSGDVDAAVADDLARAGKDCLDQDAPGLVLDLAAVTFLDSTGVGALVSVRERAIELGKTLSVVNPSRPVQKVLQITGLSEVF